MSTTIIPLLFLLWITTAVHAQNEIIPNPDAVKLRRVWYVRGSVAGGERIGEGAGDASDIDRDGIHEFGVLFGQTAQWNIYRGGDTISTTPVWQFDSAAGVPWRPVVGDFWHSGKPAVAFARATIDIRNGVPYFFARLFIYRTDNDSLSQTPTAILETSRLVENSSAYPWDILTADLDADGDDELMLVFGSFLRNGARTTNAEIWIFAGGPNFQLDTPTVVLKDPQANDDTYSVSVADIDGDGYAEIITAGLYKGSPRPARLNIWWGEKDIHDLSLNPDRSLDLKESGLTQPPIAPAIADIDGDGIADLLGNVALGNDRYSINVYRSGSGKDARTRSFAPNDADQSFTTTNFFVEGRLGYLNDSLRRYEMVPLYGPDPGGGARMLALSGGAAGLNQSYDAYYSAATDGLVEASVFGIGGPIGDATGDGWDDYLTANPNWYGPLQQGIVILLAGGPYIPNDDPTVSVREVATSERSDALHLWPNPVREVLHIAWRGDLKQMPVRMAVHDMAGRLIAKGDVAPGRGEALWCCGSAASGAYLLTIYDSRGEIIATEKILRE